MDYLHIATSFALPSSYEATRMVTGLKELHLVSLLDKMPGST